MILDPTPQPERGTIAVLGATEAGPTVFVLTGKALEYAREDGTELYVDHHDSCPKAEQFRRPSARRPSPGQLSLSMSEEEPAP